MDLSRLNCVAFSDWQFVKMSTPTDFSYMSTSAPPASPLAAGLIKGGAGATSKKGGNHAQKSRNGNRGQGKAGRSLNGGNTGSGNGNGGNGNSGGSRHRTRSKSNAKRNRSTSSAGGKGAEGSSRRDQVQPQPNSTRGRKPSIVDEDKVAIWRASAPAEKTEVHPIDLARERSAGMQAALSYYHADAQVMHEVSSTLLFIFLIFHLGVTSPC